MLAVLSFVNILSPHITSSRWDQSLQLNTRLCGQLICNSKEKIVDDLHRNALSEEKPVIEADRLADILLQMDVNDERDEEQLKQWIQSQLRGMNVPTAYSVQTTMYEKMRRIGKVYSEAIAEMNYFDDSTKLNRKESFVCYNHDQSEPECTIFLQII